MTHAEGRQAKTPRAASDRAKKGLARNNATARAAARAFSPDWSREGTEPRYSDDPYYSRNREHGDEGRDVQRSRDDEQQSHYRGHYSRSSTPFSYAGGTGYVYSESWTIVGPHTGRGPKGYRRSDQQILEEACLAARARRRDRCERHRGHGRGRCHSAARDRAGSRDEALCRGMRRIRLRRARRHERAARGVPGQRGIAELESFTRVASRLATIAGRRAARNRRNRRSRRPRNSPGARTSERRSIEQEPAGAARAAPAALSARCRPARCSCPESRSARGARSTAWRAPRVSSSRAHCHALA